MDARGQPAEVVERLPGLRLQVGERLEGHRRIARELVAGQPDPRDQRGDLLLGPVVDVALDAPPRPLLRRVDERGSIPPGTAAALADGHSVLFGMAAPMAFGVAVLATAALALRTSVLPRWLAVVSVVLGIALLVPPIAHVAAIASTFWCLVTGLVLQVQARADVAGAGAWREGAAGGVSEAKV